jgi:aryl-alcohol dehydrogenase-like predicted oxidoreductase
MAVIPRIVVGTARMGSVLPGGLDLGSRREATLRDLDALLDAGCTAYDLAASYQLGGTERLFGRWIATRRLRPRLFLIGKGGHPYPLLRPNRLSREALAADLHASLRRLGVEQLDLYLLHRDFPGASLEPMVEMLGAAIGAGKIAGWGVSNWEHPRIEAIAALAKQAGLPPIAASSPHFSLVDWARPPWTGSVSIAGPAHREARAFHHRTQLPVLAWSPLGSGFLTADDGRGRSYRSPDNQARRDRLRTLAGKRGHTVAQLALAYLFSHSFPVSAVVAASGVERMRSNLEAAAIHLTPDEVRALEGEG